MDSELLSTLKDTVTVCKRGSINEYGEPQPEAGIVYPARIQRQRKIIRNADGDEIVSSAVVYLNGTIDIDASDAIQLEDGSTPLILQVDSSPDENGNAYFRKVYL